MSANLCEACQSIHLEFFLGTEYSDRIFPENSDDDNDSFEMITSVANHPSLADAEASARGGCELCTMIVSRIMELKDFQYPDSEMESKIELGIVFDRCHRITVYYRGTTFSMPVYSAVLKDCDESKFPSSHDTALIWTF